MAITMFCRRLITVLLFSLVFIPGTFAQIRIIPREKLESVAEPRLSADSATLIFETVRIVADVMNEDDLPATFTYRFRNAGKDTVVISRLVSTCSCAAATLSKDKVMPGGEAEIYVRYNPKGHPGKFERRIFVYTGAGNDPAVVLKLAVDVENGADISGIWPVQMGNIRMRRSEVVFEEGVRAVEKLRFINLGDRSLALQCDEAFLPECLSFRTVPEIVESGQEGEIVISYDPSKKVVRENNKVILKGLGVPPSRSAVSVSIRRPINENE